MTFPPDSPSRIFPIRYLPLFYLALPFLLGIALADSLSKKTIWILTTLLSSFGILILVLQRRWKMLASFSVWYKQHLPLSPAWLLLAISAGLFRFVIAQPPLTPHELAYYNDRGKAEIIGFITDSPQLNEHSTKFTLQAESIQQPLGGSHSPWLEVSGKTQVITSGAQHLMYGNRVSIICEPQTPEQIDDFNYPRWLAARHIYTQCMFAYIDPLEGQAGNSILRGIFKLRQQADQKITAVLPSEEAALLSGILLGLENEIPTETELAFQRSGTSHIIAISGANFTLLISFATLLLLRYLPRRWSLPATLVLVTVYTIFVGGNPAVLRAAFMGVMAFSARLIGRKNQGLNSLAFSAALLCAINPLLLWDLSFQLSALATLGLVLFAMPLQFHFSRLALKYLPENLALKISGLLSEYLLMSLAAQVFTLPLIAYHFQSVSLSSIFANLLILPVQPLIMALGGLTVLFGLFFTPLGQFFAWLAWVPLAYTLRIVNWVGGWSWGFWTIDRFSPSILLIYLLFLTALPLMSGWLPRLRPKISKVTVGILACLLVIVIWHAALNQPDLEFHMRLPGLPENDAILINLPDSNAILIGRSAAVDSLERFISPYLEGYHLNTLLATSSQKASLDSMEELLNRYQPDYYLHSSFLPDPSLLLLQQNANQSGVEFHSLYQGQTINTDKSFRLEILAVRKEGTAVLMVYNDLRILIPGGIGYSELSQLSPHSLSGNTILVLTYRDLLDEDHAEWYQLPVQSILISGMDPACPPAHCRSTAEFGAISLGSDGSVFWLENH